MNAKVKLAGLLSCALLNIGAAEAATLYASSSTGGIYTIDTGSFVVTSIGNSGVGGITDIAFNGGQLYGINFNTLYKISTSNGAASSVGSTGLTDINALETGSNGQLYTAGFSTGKLSTLSTVNGANNFVGNTGVGSAGDLALGKGVMYYAGSGNNLYTVNEGTGASTHVGAMGNTWGNVYGLAFANNILYGLTDWGYLLDINTATGNATQLAYTKITGWGLTAAPVPVPAAVWLFGSAIFGWLGFGRRKALK